MSVIVYSTPRCPHCKELKAALNMLQIPFEDRDASDTDVIAGLLADGIFARAVPILQHGERYYLYDEIFDEKGVPRVDLMLSLE